MTTCLPSSDPASQKVYFGKGEGHSRCGPDLFVGTDHTSVDSVESRKVAERHSSPPRFNPGQGLSSLIDVGICRTLETLTRICPPVGPKAAAQLTSSVGPAPMALQHTAS